MAEQERAERERAEQERRKSLFRIAVSGFARAPRRMKFAFTFNITLFVTIGIYELFFDAPVPSDGPYPVMRTLALLLVMLGAFLLSLSSVLWTLSQRGDACSLYEFKIEAFRMRARRLDEVLIAFPVMAFVAGCCVAVGFGIYLTINTDPFARFVVFGVGTGFVAWTGATIAVTTRFLYTQAREQAEAAERARSEATESQLAALQAQMNPHFLFNTLNTVASLVRTDAAAAEATVENLAVVLRRTLDRSRRILSTVDDEIDHLAAYISVAKQRFEHRLQVHWSVDPDTRELLLPTMTLQPLVENALTHGIGARLEGGALHVGIHRSDAEHGSEILIVEVADDGPGFPRRHREGTGLSNLRERLETLFGDDARLDIDRSAPGSRVVITVPARTSPDEILGTVSERVELARAE